MRLNVTEEEFVRLYNDTTISIPKLSKLIGISRYKIQKLAKLKNLSRPKVKRLKQYDGT